MKHTCILVILIVNIFIQQIKSQSSPCPDIFQFHSDGQRTYGIITIPGPGVGRTIMQAKVAIRGPIYNRNGGGVRLLKSLDAAVEDARNGRDIQYLLNFPQSEQMPIVMRLILNNRDICKGPEVFNAATWTYQHEFTYPSGMLQLSHIPDRFSRPEILDNDNENSNENINPWLPPTMPFRPPPDPRPREPERPRKAEQPRKPEQPTKPELKEPEAPVETERPKEPEKPKETERLREKPGDGSWVGSLPFAETCGRRGGKEDLLRATQLIIGGEDVQQGEFPWMVALFHYQGRVPVYKCGANLISKSYVITAAHCTIKQRKVYLELGRHNISDPIEDGYIPRVSSAIYNHPEYKSGAHSDVALILIETVEFTAKIKPICLWGLGINFDSILKVGTVTGWGRIENDGDLSSTPMKLSVRTVGLDVCRNSHEKLKDIATDKTFCAGGNKSGPCHGDSGSGFYLRHSDVWYLRGIISTSLGTDFVCNLGEYAVYVDLAYYLDWIKPYLMK